ncbi:hypothetical protein BaRGS_00005590, partial [Batillaria attramentaria]
FSGKAALCGDGTAQSETVEFVFADGETPGYGRHICSCDVISARGNAVAMTISVNLTYRQSCPGLRLKFNSSATQAVQCRSGSRGVQQASFALPPLMLTSFGVRLDLDVSPRPIIMSVSLRATSTFTFKCGDAYPAAESTTAPPHTMTAPNLTTSAPPTTTRTTASTKARSSPTDQSVMTSPMMSPTLSTQERNGSCDRNETMGFFNEGYDSDTTGNAS